MLPAPPPPDSFLPLRTEIRAKMTAERIPGAALAIFRGGKAVLTEGFGTTERDGGRKVDGDTIFEAASLTKPVFALAVLRLAERGELDLDAPLLSYLPGPYVHAQRPWDPKGKRDEVLDLRLARVTARSVLSHRTGLPNIVFNAPLTFLREPNGEWGYSGEGFRFLQRAVEARTGKSAETLVEEEVLTPLGMRRTTLGALSFDIGNVASGYDSGGGIVPEITSGSAIGSLRTTLNDYARFLLFSRRYRPFARVQTVADEASGLDWGLGWGLARDGRDRALFQWGWNDGFRNFALLNLRTGDGLLLFTSSDDGMELAPLALKAALGRSLPVLRFPMLGLRPD